MVQQPTSGGQLSSVGSSNSANSLAMPAIVSASPHQQQNQAPAIDFYQQQLIKSAQQFMGPQQQASLRQQQHLYGTQDHSSPINQQQQVDQTAPLYNGVQQGAQNFQSAQIYAGKSQMAFYGQQASLPSQPLYQPISRQQQSQPIYHHSPLGLSQPNSNGPIQQSPMGLSVRQLTMQNSPIQLGRPGQDITSPPTQAADHQRQQLILSYQQQLNSIHQASFLPITSANQQDQLVHQQPQQAAHVDIAWSQMEKPHQTRTAHRRAQAQERMSRSRFSDRDSISTLSRLDQLDDRRSFTMRSQCTNVNNANRYANQFGFFKVAGEALKKILGIGDYRGERRLLPDGEPKPNLHKNLNLSVTISGVGIKSSQPHSSDNYRPSHGNSNNVTIIDSGENYYFKRRVFKFQLTLIRTIGLLCSICVLLSPVIMLLIPKMEFLINGELNDPSSTTAAQSNRELADQIPPVTGIKHSVGLSGLKQNLNQPPYFAPQPQWRISECGSDCDGPLIGFVVRFIMLCIAYWALYARTQTGTLPRVDMHRCLVISMAFLLTSAYWLFFIFRVFDKRYNDFELQYITIIHFATSMLESLILLHYLAVVLLELRKRRKVYCIKVVRSPDGASNYFSCGALSIQQCAQYVIEKYSKHFKHHGPYSEHLIELEDELALTFGGGKGEHNGDKTPRSRPSSPAHHTRSETLDRGSRRSASRSSRHHSKSGTDHHRSPSNSPVRHGGRPKSQRKSFGADPDDSKTSERTRLEGKATNTETKDTSVTVTDSRLNTISKDMDGNENKAHDNDNNSGDQSSEATSRMKESSLETIRAANSNSDLLGQQKPSASQRSSNLKNSKSEDSSRYLHARDETESVRSVRSRRSTTRSHHRHRSQDHHHNHHQSHREHSSNRADIESSSSDPLEDHERKLRRRKLRLLMSVQETFDQIKRAEEGNPLGPLSGDGADHNPGNQPLGAWQTSRLLYPNFARTLQKYLKITKQTGRHNLQSIYEHLSKCLVYNLGARAFLEKFTNQDPVLQQAENNLFVNCRLNDQLNGSQAGAMRQVDNFEINSWSLICDTLVSRQISAGTFFLLKQGRSTLLVTVAKIPHLSLSEEVIDPKSCKFLIKDNSETSV